jgi:hypothetical protein
MHMADRVVQSPQARQRMLLRVEQGKGQKDRYTLLSPKLSEGALCFVPIIRMSPLSVSLETTSCRTPPSRTVPGISLA